MDLPAGLPDRFDALGSLDDRVVCRLTLPGRRETRYVDEGEPGWRPLVFFGGLGTSAGAFYLTEFARSLRVALRLRVTGVERNGFGETPFDPSLGYADAVDDVLAVLEALDISRFSVVAFSGGGPYAAALAAAVPDRLLSLHLAAAAAGALSAAVGEALDDPAAVALDPRAMWEFPARSPVHVIPGFARAAGEEGVQALGRGESPEAPAPGAQALAHAWHLLSTGRLPDLSAVRAPAYLYWGTHDDLVPPAHAHVWLRALPNVVARRCYEGEEHDVQYRHWDQILVDAALADSLTMICLDGRTMLVPDADVPGHLADGATLGMCAWAHHGRVADTEPRLEAA